jgi:hypothetical protein
MLQGLDPIARLCWKAISADISHLGDLLPMLDINPSAALI